jgi:hypothetical protein
MRMYVYLRLHVCVCVCVCMCLPLFARMQVRVNTCALVFKNVLSDEPPSLAKVHAAHRV